MHSVKSVACTLWFRGYVLEENYVCCSYIQDLEEKRHALSYSDDKTPSLSEQGTLCVTGPNQVRILLFLRFPIQVLIDSCCCM